MILKTTAPNKTAGNEWDLMTGRRVAVFLRPVFAIDFLAIFVCLGESSRFKGIFFPLESWVGVLFSGPRVVGRPSPIQRLQLTHPDSFGFSKGMYSAPSVPQHFLPPLIPKAGVLDSSELIEVNFLPVIVVADSPSGLNTVHFVLVIFVNSLLHLHRAGGACTCCIGILFCCREEPRGPICTK
jgi:hypothetical protein